MDHCMDSYRPQSSSVRSIVRPAPLGRLHVNTVDRLQSDGLGVGVGHHRTVPATPCGSSSSFTFAQCGGLSAAGGGGASLCGRTTRRPFTAVGTGHPRPHLLGGSGSARSATTSPLMDGFGSFALGRPAAPSTPLSSSHGHPFTPHAAAAPPRMVGMVSAPSTPTVMSTHSPSTPSTYSPALSVGGGVGAGGGSLVAPPLPHRGGVHRLGGASHHHQLGLGLGGAGPIAAGGRTEAVLPVYSAFKVLDAKQMSSDYYSQCLSYGRSMIVTCIGQQVLLFNPDDLSTYGTATLPMEWADGNTAAADTSAAPSAPPSLRTPRAVYMSHYSDTHAFVGDAEGGVALLAMVEGTTRLSIVDYYDGRKGSGGSAAAVHCITSSPHQPYLFLAGFGDGTVGVFDTRRKGLIVSSAQLPLPSAMLEGARQRIVAMAINCSGGLLALGTSHGVVQVYPLGSAMQGAASSAAVHAHANTTRDAVPSDEASPPPPRSSSPLPFDDIFGRPLMAWAYSDWSAARALAFHPTVPSELSVGGGVGDGAIRTVCAHTGRLLAMVRTGSQVAQLSYSADGSHLVSTHGFAVRANGGSATFAAVNGNAHDANASSAGRLLQAADGDRIASPVDLTMLEGVEGASPSPASHSHGGAVVCSIPGNSVAVWARGAGGAPPLPLALPSEDGMGTPSAAGSDGGSPITDAGRAMLRRAHLHSTASAEDGGALRNGAPATQSIRQLSAASVSLFPQHGGAHNAANGRSTQWRKALCLTQHTARPLFLSRCRLAGSGVFGTAAGAEDCSIRLWHLIDPRHTSHHQLDDGGAGAAVPSASSAAAANDGGASSRSASRRGSPLMGSSSYSMLGHQPSRLGAASGLRMLGDISAVAASAQQSMSMSQSGGGSFAGVSGSVYASSGVDNGRTSTSMASSHRSTSSVSSSSAADIIGSAEGLR